MKNLKPFFINQKFFLSLLLFIKIIIIINTNEDNCENCKVNNNKCIPDCTEDQTNSEGCKCIDNCRPHLYNTDKCYDCTNAFNTPNSIYYIENGICLSKLNTQCEKIIIENNECVDNFNIIGDQICSPQKPYIIEEIFQEKKYLRCTKSCPSGYFDYRTKKCVDKCKGETDKITKENGCADSCNGNQFLYTFTEMINGEKVTKKYCLDECPNQALFFYTNQFPLAEKECLPKCNEGDFYSITTHECSSSCDTMAKIDVNNNIYQCSNIRLPTENEYKCEKDFPYQYKDYCFRNCSDTQKLDFLDNKITYFLKKVNGENEEYYCSKDCTEDSTQPFFDLTTLSCHAICQETSNKFYYVNQCINSCEEKNYLYHMTDGKCVMECNEDSEQNYYLLRKEKICYDKKCPKNSEYKYINNKYKECTTCNIPKNYENIEYGEGYIKEEEDQEDVILSCLESFPENDPLIYYRRNDDNKIRTFSSDSNAGCKDNNDEYKYSTSGYPHICYKSCNDITGEYIHQYGYECRNERDTNIYSYYLDHGIFKYINEEENKIDEICSSKGLYYKREIKNDEGATTGKYECIKDCNQEEYRIPFSTDQNNKIILGECLEECPGESSSFFSLEEKICREECPFKEIKFYDQSESKYSKISSENSKKFGNCVTECPSQYSFESEDGKFCYDVCPEKYFITDDQRKKCITNCKSISKYNFKDNNQCIDECKIQENNQVDYYYYNEDNICLFSCKTNEEFSKYFSLKAENYPQPCIKECPKGNNYYYEENNICLKECENGFVENINSTKCVNSCEKEGEEGQTETYYVIKGNICSKSCTNEEPFYMQIVERGKTINKCTSNCEIINNSFKFYKNITGDEDENQLYECLPSCSGDHKLEYGKECLKKCPKGLYEENQICKSKCSDGLYYEKNNEGNNYKCIETCGGKYISSNGECLEKCPLGENFIGVGNKCKSSCDINIDGEYYGKDGEQPTGYSIYKCVKNCNDFQDSSGNNIKPFIIYETKECVSGCSNPYKSSSDNICYSSCLKSDKYQFTLNDSCSQSCTDDVKKNYQDDKVCVNGCNNAINNIINEKDNSCVNKCDINSLYRYLKTINDVKHCVNSCDKYTINNYYCYDNEVCPKPFNFIIGNECHDKCQELQFASPEDENEPPNEYKCTDFCDKSPYLYYYENENICLKKCNSGDFNIQNTKICVKSCNEKSTEDNKYFYYEPKDENSIFKINTCVTECPIDKQFYDIDNYCSEKCKYNGYQYYIPSDNICRDKCPEEYKKNGFECVIDCPIESNKYVDETDTCVSSCLSSKAGYNYYYESERKCLKKCKDGDYIYKDYECKSSCPDDKKYIYNQNCVDYCPSNQKYFIANFEHGEIDLKQYCLTDCPKDYQFLHIEDIDSNNKLFKCLGSCENYYITNKDEKIIAKECVTSCPFFINHNSTHRECVDICPNEKKYFVNLESNQVKECLEHCPSTHPYHKMDSFECIESCDTNYAIYKEKDKQCVSNCDINSFWIKEKTPDDKEITLCLNNCNEIEYTHFYTPERECVIECDETLFLRGNKNNGTCECMNLYYFNDEGILKCFDNNIKQCGEIDKDSKDYPIQINGTNQCVKNCFGVLSPSENICYLNDLCPENTEKGIYDGKIKCECKYKYYFDANQKKICLSKDEKCPSNYKYLIPEKKQCIQNCDGYNIIFDNKCLQNCPSGMSETEEEDEIEEEGKKACKCKKNWYKESDNKYICLNEDEVCTENFPYLIKETNECVKKCSDTNYNIFYNNECLSSCGNNMDKIPYEETDISSYTCKCKYLWSENGECSQNNNNNCTIINGDLKYLVKYTNQCVKNCPNKYGFYFNNECFSNCAEAKQYGYNVKQKGSTNECKCEEYWRINPENNLIVCLDKCDDEITIEVKKQCIIKSSEDFKCPYDSPYLYNNICYKTCPQGTSIDIFKGNECKCNNIWYKQQNGLIYCEQNINGKCQYNTHPYYIKATKECVSEKEKCNEQNYNKEFNYVCYSNCPTGTKEKENENICECDNQKYFWYKEKNSTDLREYYACGLKNCSNANGRLYYINETKECINDCSDRGLYKYGEVCYKDCPLFTQKNKNDYSCELSPESEKLEVIVANISNKIAEIYHGLPEGGLVINNEKASLQIYGLNREDKKNKQSIMRTNLAYIDLSGCIDKIYESNNMENKDDIVVVKLDLKSKNKKLIVNPIEYEFINSKDGRKLDASVCEKNEVVISYPITYMLKKLRNLEDEEIGEDEKKEILNKFNKGKLLYEKDKSIDTFNFNSSIYSDICISVEIDGKDLVLEDRLEYLFPNYSFCESMCTYDYTDFEGERIYCNCSIKSEIDVDRSHQVQIYQINKNEIDNNQKGPTNLPVLKCLEKAKIMGNAAFIICLIFIIIEIGLLFIVIFQGIYSLINKIREKIIDSKEDEKNINIEYNNSENDKIKNNKIDKTYKYSNNNTSDNNSSSTKRNMNTEDVKMKSNPPKHNIVIADDEDQKNEVNVISIKKNKNKYNEYKQNNLNIEEKNNYNEKNNYETISEANDIEINKYLQKNGIETQKGFFQSMKEEEKLIRTKYNYSLLNDKFDSIVVVLTSIFDKIYIIKILLLPGKYDIISLIFSLYLLCHMLLLTFLTFFYDIKTIHNIWEKENYPNTNYYLLYGFISNLIVWIIFKLFTCLLSNEHKVKKLYNVKSSNNAKVEEKFNKISYKIKRNVIIYLVIQFLLILFCSFYLITFCGIYLGTKNHIFESYGIAFIEIIIIKIIYGLILGILRKVSLYKKISLLYNIVLILNKYIS